MKKTVVIFGVSSFVGSNLAEYLKKYYRVIGTYHHTRVEIPGVLCIPCNVLDKDRVNYVTATFKPKYTIYAIGLTSIEQCAKYDKAAEALNTGGLVNVSEMSERIKAKTCLISTEFVFSGHNEIYQEKDNPDPNTAYGKTKVSGEFYVQKSCLNYIIVRSCSLYGRCINPRDLHWFETMERKFGEGESFGLDSTVHTGFLDVNYLGACLRLCFEKEITNRLIQLTSTDSTTRYGFAEKYAEVFKANENLITKTNWPLPEIEYISSDKHIPGDDYYYKMSFENLEGLLSIDMPTIEESLKYTFMKFGGKETKGETSKSSSTINYI